MNIVDFTEIRDSLIWENLAKAFFIAKGMVILEGPTTGGDGGTGKDLIVEETLSSEFGSYKRKILVSCKHKAISGKSVNADDEKDNIILNIIAENCCGFLGFYSTSVSSPLQSKIHSITKHEKVKIDIAGYYDSEAIERFLLFEDKDNLILKRFFPESYKKWKKLGDKNVERNTNFKKLSEVDLKPKNKDYFKKYYEGQPPDWSIIRKYTFKRDCFENTIRYLEINKVCLVTGAGGEGKTTFLMQLGDYFFQKSFTVLYSFGIIANLDLSLLKFVPERKYLLILDNAYAIRNLAEFVKKVKLSNNVFAVLASRKNEWFYSLSNLDNKEDLSRWIGAITKLQKLSNNEISLLLKLLKKNKVLNGEVEEKISVFINDNTNANFLLAVMIYATQGKSFEMILKDVISKIRCWNDSHYTIEAIGFICAIEVLGKGFNGQTYCQETLLKKLLQLKDNVQYQTIKNYLAEEAFFQGSFSNIIHTRNPLIAKIYFDCLFESELPLLDKYDVYYNIIREISFTQSDYGRNILSLIPAYFIDKENQLSIQLLKDVISYGFFWNTFYKFVDHEILNENIGRYNSDVYSARWLLQKAFERNSKDPVLFVYWAEFELSQNNLGSYDKEFSARWIFLKGYEMAPYDQLFSHWANAEVRVENLGENVEKEYSARWISREGIERCPSENTFHNWAKIEINARNFGIDVSDEYTARWIFNQGFNKAPTSGFMSSWASFEVSEFNIGDSIYVPNTARWICFEGVKKCPLYDIYVTWANIEAGAGNLGINIKDKYTARWICFEGIKIFPIHDLYITWINFEVIAGNIGIDIGDKHTARWICFEGTEKNKSKDLVSYRLILFKWIQLECTVNNLGSKDKQYSAEWLYGLFKKEFGAINGALSVKELRSVIYMSVT